MNDETRIDELLHDAVADVEPADRLSAIRARTTTPARAARRWWGVAGGVVLATAATVAVVAVLDDGSGSGRHDHHHGNDPVATDPMDHMVLVPTYYVGPTPHGDRLFREFDHALGDDPVQAALEQLQRPASDPDYRVSWQQGSFTSAKVEGSRIDVEVGDDVPVRVSTADLATQSVVYTLQGAAGARLPVRFVHDGVVVLGNVTAKPQLDVLSQVMVNDPSEGLAVHGWFTARGAASSFEANVPWEIRDEHGTVVRKGHATATGWGDRLYPWSTRVDVSGLPYGSYTFAAMTDDPSDGEGGGPFTDTRTIIVR